MPTHDIALYSATGFTGRLTAQYLASTGVDFCIAGRNRAKLERVAKELGVDVPIVVASSADPESLRALAAGCRVLVSTVGPFARHGIPVVEAAVEAGCDYLDITGEPDFVSESRSRFDAAAREKKLRIVHCCGADSLPHDVGAWFTVQQLPADADLQIEEFVSMRSRISGGTWASIVNGVSSYTASKRKPKRSARPAETDGYRVELGGRLHRRRSIKGWAVPMPLIDPIIVARSARSLGYGRSLAFDFYWRFGRKRTVLGAALGAAGLMVASKIPGALPWLEAQWPSGSGPDEEERESGMLRARFEGQGGGRRVVCEVSCDRDPGYAMTATWLGECARCLVEDRDRLPERYGVITPVMAMESAIFERMRATGTRFEVLSGGDA